MFTADGLLCRDDGRFYLVHRSRYNDWSFLKGKLEPGETLAETVVREVREEMKYEVDCGWLIGRYEYRTLDDAGIWSGSKGVFVWHMRVVDEHQFESDTEVDACQRVTPVEVLQRLIYETKRALARRTFELSG